MNAAITTLRALVQALTAQPARSGLVVVTHDGTQALERSGAQARLVALVGTAAPPTWSEETARRVCSRWNDGAHPDQRVEVLPAEEARQLRIASLTREIGRIT